MDINKIAKEIVDEATLDNSLSKEAAKHLGQKGGLKGGKARAEKLSPRRRKEIAQKAAYARHGKKWDAEWDSEVEIVKFWETLQQYANKYRFTIKVLDGDNLISDVFPE